MIAPSLTALGAGLHQVGAGGRPLAVPLDVGELSSVLQVIRPSTILVHGYGFDPTIGGRDNPHQAQFPPWRQWAPATSVGFAWPSAPGWCRSWSAGRVHPYHYAYDVADYLAARLLYAMLERLPLGRRVSLVGHSLGSRVILGALRRHAAAHGSCGLPVDRVLLLNGAEYSAVAREVAKACPAVGFYNVAVSADAVLRFLGALFAPGPLYAPVIGLHGLEDPPANWHDIALDGSAVQAWGQRRGWDLAGNHPWRIGDHWHAWRHEGNWPLYAAILRGDALTGLPAEG